MTTFTVSDVTFPELWELLNAVEQRLQVLALHADHGLPEVAAAMGRLITSRDKLRTSLGIETFDPAEGSIDPPRDGIPDQLLSYMVRGA